jgi:hypothetical protein
VFFNLEADGQNGASNTGFALGQEGHIAIGCKAIDCNNGISLGSAFGCHATGCNNAGFYICPYVAYSAAYENSANAGFYNSHTEHCVAWGNTGRGFWIVTRMRALNCTSYNNTTDGFDCTAGSNMLVNCVAVDNGGWGYNADASEGNRLLNCASYNNTSGREQNYQEDIGAITLSADPFNAPLTDDFRPDNDATGGELLKGAGFVPKSVSAVIDVGYLMRATLAGGLLTHPGMSGGMRG